MLRLRPLLLLLAVLALACAACGDDDDRAAGASDGERRGSGATAPSRRRAAAARRSRQPAPKPDGGAKQPDASARRRRDLRRGRCDTSCGDITIRLDQKTVAASTAASFASLADSGFYDGTVFHRIVPGFVIQGGDPTGTGTGGPGYSTRDVPPQDTIYTQGRRRDGQDRPPSRPAPPGSQFYIVTAPDAGCRPSTRCSARS